MNCRDIDRALIEREPLSSPQWSVEARDHLAVCDRCQSLVHLLLTPVHDDMPSPVMLLQIERCLTTNLQPVRLLPSLSYFFTAFAATVALLVALGAYRMRGFAISFMSPIEATAILFFLAASAAVLAYSLVRQMVPGSRQLCPTYVLSGVIILLFLVASLFRFRQEPGFWQTGWACLRTGVSYALMAMLPFCLLLRQGAVVSPRVTGATAGLLAGLIGTSVLEITCLNFNALHIMMWHVGVAMLGALVGLVAGVTKELLVRRRSKK